MPRAAFASGAPSTGVPVDRNPEEQSVEHDPAAVLWPRSSACAATGDPVEHVIGAFPRRGTRRRAADCRRVMSAEDWRGGEAVVRSRAQHRFGAAGRKRTGESRRPCIFVGRTRALCCDHDDHNSDGPVSMWYPAPPGAQEHLVSAEPSRFFRPPTSRAGRSLDGSASSSTRPITTRSTGKRSPRSSRTLTGSSHRRR